MRSLVLEVHGDRLLRGPPHPGFLQLHDLVAAIADVEHVVEPRAALQLAVVIRDQLADVGGEECFV